MNVSAGAGGVSLGGTRRGKWRSGGKGRAWSSGKEGVRREPWADVEWRVTCMICVYDMYGVYDR